MELRGKRGKGMAKVGTIQKFPIFNVRLWRGTRAYRQECRLHVVLDVDMAVVVDLLH